MVTLLLDGWPIKHRASRPSKWMNISSPNSLADVYQLYCGGSMIDKSARDIFVTGSITDIRDNFQVKYYTNYMYLIDVHVIIRC